MKKLFKYALTSIIAASLAIITLLPTTEHVASASGPYSVVYPVSWCYPSGLVDITPAGLVCNLSSSSSVVLTCPMPLDNNTTYNSVTAWLYSNGVNNSNTLPINGQTCTGSICMDVCTISWGVLSCGPLATYSGAAGHASSSISYGTGWGPGSETVLQIELAPETSQNCLLSYVVSHN